MSRPVPVLPVALFASLAVVLSACGGGSAAQAPTGAATTTAPATPTAALPEGRGSVTTNADGTRTVTSSYGTATVPADPKRIVSVIGDIDLDALVALGEPVVGAGTQGGTTTSGFAPHLAARVGGVTPLAWTDGVPYESIAALEPDLIFAPDEESYDKLSQIATTVPRGSWSGPDWKEDFRYVAAVVGRSEQAETLLAAHQARVARMKADLAGKLPAGTTVASPQVSYDAANVYVDPSDAFSSAILTELGLTLHPIAATAKGEGRSVSFERLTDVSADVLFWQVRQKDDGTPDTQALTKATGSPLWKDLPAVAADSVHQVVNRPWYFPGITAAGVVLDDVERYLLATS